jgi:hypothetical protein
VAGETGVRKSILRRRDRPDLPREVLPPVLAATVFVRPELLWSIEAACGGARDVETGGPLIGTVQRSWEPRGKRLIVAVLGTVPPGPGLVARSSSVGIGEQTDGDRAASALRWWRSATGLELVHLGDWHMHPSGYSEPSAGDDLTAHRMHKESGGPVWLAAIAAGAERRDDALETEEHVARLSGECASLLEIAFYRDVGRMELSALPIRVEGAAIPRLPALPWHLADPMRFAVECRLLDAAGFKTAISTDEHVGLELRLSRNGRAVTVTTGSGYPVEEPKVAGDRRLRVRRRGWSPDRFLVDLVREAC